MGLSHILYPSLGNLAQYLDGKDAFGALNSDSSRLIRLFFQPVLIAWALWSSGAWQSWRNTKKVNSKLDQ
jgi:hypothetical protein